MTIDGKLAAENLRSEIAIDVEAMKMKHGVIPGLTVVLVGQDPASEVYVRNKVKQTKQVGMHSNEIRLPADTTEETLLNTIYSLNENNDVHGILVQLPLPKHINEESVIAAISPIKDVDGFHALNSGKLLNGEDGAHIPCTPQGCILLAKSHLGEDLSGLHAVVIGRSNIVGKPVSMLLLQENCTVTMVHSRSKNIEQLCQQADILVAAVGIPEMVKKSWLKPGATVIDVGINRIERECGSTQLVGDVDFNQVSEHCNGITPVPGGVGPMTIACLLKNTLSAATLQLD